MSRLQESETPRTPEGARGLPLRLKAVLPGLVIALLGLRVLTPVSDLDTFWHVAAGEHLASTWDFVLQDPFGAASSRPWILNQWLPELVMGAMDQGFGLAGVAWLVPLMVVSILVSIWLISRRRASILISCLLMAVALLAMSASISPRPQLVSFLLTLVYVEAWLRTADDNRPRWWLVPLTWLWACSHGLWVVGVIIGAAVVVAIAMNRQTERRTLGRLVLVPVLGVAAAALTPVGPVLLTSPFQVASITSYVTEWRPPSATDPAFLAAMSMLLTSLMFAARDARGRTWPALFLLATAGVLAFSSLRTVALAAAVLVPITAFAAQHLSALKRENLAAREVRVVVGASAAVLVASALIAPSVAGGPTGVPATLDTQIAAVPRGSIICNDWDYGGYLIWAHPNVRVTMDSRVEIYSTDHIESYASFVSARPGWKAYVADTQCTYALVRESAAVVEALRDRLGWTIVAARDGSVLLKAPEPDAALQPAIQE